MRNAAEAQPQEGGPKEKSLIPPQRRIAVMERSEAIHNPRIHR